MPDWNPAEIIGLRPRPLAFSLYREWITDNTWAYQRNNYGYKNMRSHPLLIGINGLPYIDVKCSFMSLIPRSVDNICADTIVNSYVNQLISSPFLHDKIEFSIALSCWTFNMQDKIDNLLDTGVSRDNVNTLLDSLFSLKKILKPNSSLLSNDFKRLKSLKSLCEPFWTNLWTLYRVYWLTEYSKRYGSSFAGHARAAFISVELLNSLVAKDFLPTKIWISCQY